MPAPHKLPATRAATAIIAAGKEVKYYISTGLHEKSS